MSVSESQVRQAVQLPHHRLKLPTAGQLVGPCCCRRSNAYRRRDDTGGACLDLQFADAGF